MRIVHVTNYVIPAYGYEELPLAVEQQRLGHSVSVVTSNYLHPAGAYAVLRQSFQERRVQPRREQRDGVDLIRLAGVEVAKRVWIRGLERTLLRLQPEVVHCHDLLQFHPARVALLKATRRMRAVLVVDDHMHNSFVRRSTTGRLFYATYRRLLQPLLATYIDAYAAIGEDTKSYLAKACGVHADIAIMPLGVDSEAFAPSPARREDWRRRLGLSADDLVFMYCGKVVKAKGVHIVLRAALKLIRDRFPLKVLVVGDADPVYLGSLKAEVESSNMEEHFRFLSSLDRDNLPGPYAAADVAIWPTEESMGVYEAMASGLPFIVSASSGLAGLAATGSGLTYSDGADSLADAMLKLRSRPVRAQFGSRGRLLAEAQYSWSKSAERYLSLYNELLGTGAGNLSVRRS